MLLGLNYHYVKKPLKSIKKQGKDIKQKKYKKSVDLCFFLLYNNSCVREITKTK